MTHQHTNLAEGRSAPDDLVVLRPEGLYCPQGDFHIDPWRPVERAVITHAHADHARSGHRHYLCAEQAREVMRVRLGSVSLQTLGWAESLTLGAVRISFHPAGHVLGSAQLRIASGGRVWVATGDYKLAPDPTCQAFEPVRCDVLITESTFGLPVYRWAAPDRTFADILDWWQGCARERRPCVLFAYSLGKAQRLIAGLSAAVAGALPGPLAIHPAIEPINRAYRATGIPIPECEPWVPDSGRRLEPGTLLISPPAASGSVALGREPDLRLAVASGWMQVRGARRRRGVDRGFVLSDHADWPALNQAIRASGASRVIVTHGFESAMVRHLKDEGLMASSFVTEFGDERDDGAVRPESVS